MPRINLTHQTIKTLTAGRWLTDYWDEVEPDQCPESEVRW